MLDKSKVFSLICSFLMLFLYSCSNKEISTEEIFESNKESVVELKANTGEDLVTYGSAVLIDKEGTFLSNAHLVCYKSGGEYKDFENVSIRFCFEEKYRSVEVIKYDRDIDLSVLSLKDKVGLNLLPLSISQEEVKQGNKVFAIGNSMNHGLSITEGIISIPQINIEYEGINKTVIQCDLVINEGNSGGALINKKGQLIGITTFRLKDDKGNIIYGVAFCIPIQKGVEYLD